MLPANDELSYNRAAIDGVSCVEAQASTPLNQLSGVVRNAGFVRGGGAGGGQVDCGTDDDTLIPVKTTKAPSPQADDASRLSATTKQNEQLQQAAAAAKPQAKRSRAKRLG